MKAPHVIGLARMSCEVAQQHARALESTPTYNVRNHDGATVEHSHLTAACMELMKARDQIDQALAMLGAK